MYCYTFTQDLIITAVIIVTVQVRSLYTHKAEPATVKNLKRGVASMLMIQLKSGKMMEVKAVFHIVPYSLLPTQHLRHMVSSGGVSSTTHPVHYTLLKCTVLTFTCCGAQDNFQLATFLKLCTM